jgi:hypothetical protein
MTIPTSTSLVQRIENALASSDLHSAEVAGLIKAAMAAEGRFQNLISQLNILLTALTAAEKAALRQNPAPLFMAAYNEQDHFSDWATEPDHRSRSEIQKPSSKFIGFENEPDHRPRSEIQKPPSKVFGFENEPTRRSSHQRR